MLEEQHHCPARKWRPWLYRVTTLTFTLSLTLTIAINLPCLTLTLTLILTLTLSSSVVSRHGKYALSFLGKPSSPKLGASLSQTRKRVFASCHLMWQPTHWPVWHQEAQGLYSLSVSEMGNLLANVFWIFHCFYFLLNTSSTLHSGKNSSRDRCGGKSRIPSLPVDAMFTFSIPNPQSPSASKPLCVLRNMLQKLTCFQVCKICVLIFFLKGHKFMLFSTLCKANNTPLVQNIWSATVL